MTTASVYSEAVFFIIFSPFPSNFIFRFNFEWKYSGLLYVFKLRRCGLFYS